MDAVVVVVAVVVDKVQHPGAGVHAKQYIKIPIDSGVCERSTLMMVPPRFYERSSSVNLFVLHPLTQSFIQFLFFYCLFSYFSIA